VPKPPICREIARRRSLPRWVYPVARQFTACLIVWAMVLADFPGAFVDRTGSGSRVSDKHHALISETGDLLLRARMASALAASPIIYSISPNNVPARQTVSISGANLGTSGTITVGGVAASISSWGAYSISFLVPTTAPTGTDSVVVKPSGGGSVSTTLNVVFAPVLASISPTIGLPFAQVTLNGSGFGTVSGGTVTFTGVAAQILSWTDSRIVVKAPDGGAGRGPVVVTWQGVNSNAITYNYIPTISYLSQSTVARTYGSFSVVGENFLPQTGTVTLNGVPINIFTWSNNSISLPVPQNNCTGPIVVTTIYGASNPVTLTILGSTPGCMNAPQPPVANAGMNQSVPLGSTVQLDGSGSTDPNGLSLTYQWSLTAKPSGSAATLSSSTAVKPTFIADKAGSYTAQLVVSDSSSSSSPSSVVISTQIAPPTANAGANQSVTNGATVHLDGSQSTDPNGFPLTYLWSFVSVPSGSSATLSSTTAVNPTFLVDKVGNFVVQLVVNNGHLSSQPAQVTVSDVFTAPTANAGANQSVEVNTVVTLDGSHSTDLQGYPLTYSWTLLSAPAGSAATILNPTAVQPTLKPDLLGNYVAQLIVNDGVANSQPSTVTISTTDVAPVANPGIAQTVTVGTVVALDGTGSTDSDARALTYAWSVTSKPAGSNAALSASAAAKPTIVVDLPGNYVIQLIVNDGFLSSTPTTVTISTNDVPPVANPGGNQTVSAGATVELDGSASSDSVNHPLTYAWAILSEPSGGTATLSSSTVAKPTFVAAIAGTYVVQLIVNDGYVNSQPATVTVTAKPVNKPPVVSAGANQTITLPTNSVTLNGTATDDGLPNSTLAIQWSVLASANGSTVTFSQPTSAVTQATFSGPGQYVLQLSANDSQYTTSATTTITVNQPVVNQPPVVSAGANQTIQLPTKSVVLAGTATDDGLPSGILNVQWSEIAGPGAVSFSAPNAASTTATFSGPGVYLLRLTASDTQLTSASDVTVTVQSSAGVNQAPVVTAGPAQAIVLPQNSVLLQGEASDDGLPSGQLTQSWTQIGGPVTATIVSPASAVTRVNFVAAGTYTFELSASDTQLSSSATVSVVVYPTSGKNQAPYVNAGPDQTVILPNGILLNGSAADDGLPNGTLVLGWTQVSGPATAVFGSPTTATTTVAFPEAGEYVLQLAVSDSQLSSVSTVHVHVLTLAGARTNKGTDFWLAFPTNYNYPTIYPDLNIAADIATTGTVTVPGLAFSQSFALAAGASTTVTLPTNILLLNLDPFNTGLIGEDLVQFKGIHVTSSQPVTVGAIDLADYSTDGYLALPTPMLGTDYITLGYRNVFIDGISTQYGTDFAIAAAYDGTTVTITPSTDTQGRKAGVPYNVILNQGRTYELLNDSQLGADLSGTIIHADKPVAVFSGHWCANVGNAGACNQLVEQLPPIDQWGMNFVAAQFATRTSPYVLHVVAARDNTNVSVNGQGVSTLKKGGVYEGLFSQPANVTADQPVLVAQYAQSAGVDSPTNANGDPTMVLLEPITGYTSSYDVSVPTQALPATSGPPYTFQENYANVSIPQSALGSFAVDGANVSTAGFVAVPNTAFYVAAVPLTPGPHALTANAPFGAAIYGFANYDAYSYPGGISVDSVPNSTVLITPASQSQQTGSQHCAAARITDSFGNGMGGIRLGFAATGANTALRSGLTDFAGLTQFCYTGGQAGADTITVSAGGSQATATVTWQNNLGNQAPYVNAGPAQTIIASQPLTLPGIATDDGLPSGTLSVQWTSISGPGTVTFSAANSADTLASFSAVGSYQLQLSATDGQLSSTSLVSITVNTPLQNQAPVVSAGANFTLDLNTQTDGIVTLNGSVTDDGLPAGTKVMSSWVIASCNIVGVFSCAGPVIYNPTSPVTQVLFPALQTSTGSYTFQLTGDDTQLTTSSEVTVNVIGAIGPPSVTSLSVTPSSPTLPNATVTATATVSDPNLPANAPLTYQWIQLNGPAQVSFSTPTQISTQVSFPQAGIYEIQINVNNGGQSGYSIAQITVNPAQQPPLVTASASPTSIALPTNSVTLTGTATPNGTSGTLTYLWTQTYGPGGGATIATPTQLASNVTFATAGTYNFTFTAFNGSLSNTAVVSVTVSPANQPPVVSAGPAQSISLPNATTTLAGSATDDGLPSGSTLTTAWTLVSGPAPVTFGTPTKPVTTVTFTAAGSYDLRLSANDTQYTSTSDVIITVTAAPQNQPPTVFAGVNQTVNFSVGYAYLSGSATDDGLPTGSHLTTQWSEVSGPGTIMFTGNGASLVTYAYFTVPGVYVLQLSANDTQLTSTSNITVTVLPPVNQPPVVFTGSYAPITLPSSTFNLVGTVSDDGLPAGGTLTQMWTERYGPAACTFSNPNQAATQINCPAAGAYYVDLTASDGQLSTTAEVLLVVNPASAPPQVSAGNNQTIQLPANTLTLSGTAVAGTPGQTLSVTWSQVYGPTPAIIANPNQLNTLVTFNSIGNYIGSYNFQLLVTGGGYTATSNVNITVNPASQPPTAQLFTPSDGTEITQPVVVTGSVSPVNWVLEYSPNTGDGPSGIWTQFARVGQSSTQINDTTLGTFDPTSLQNGSYTIRLTANNQYGQTAVSSVTVTVARNMKVGVLQLAFNDLTVPVAGVPIQLIRSYNSLNAAHNGDFGNGWNLALSNIQLQKNHILGKNWTESTQFSGYFVSYCLASNTNNIVSVTFPDGKVYSFQAVSNPYCQSLGPNSSPTVGFTELPGTAGTAGATLVAADGGQAQFGGAIPGTGDLLDFSGNTYNPTLFILTTADGTSYTIDEQLGLTKLVDRFGNTLTISASGIISSTGKSITITRDSLNHITEIDDPNGNRLRYGYSGNELYTFQNAHGDITYFSSSSGFLQAILPPGASTYIVFQYDGNGKLIGSTDLLGGQIQYTHDVPGQQETIKDRNGNSTVYNYDADGNITKVTDALGHITTSTYDANDNKLSETNALGKTTSYTYDGLGNRTSETDPLGHTTTYAFNGLKQPLTITDALGNTTTNNYDAQGNLLSRVDPQGKTTTNTYFSNGQLQTTQDALNNITSFTYDATGNLQTQTDALNHVSTFAYDANGNRTSQAVMRTKSDGTHETLTTSYAYDANNRLIKTTNPDGTFTQIQFNTLGQQSATIDAKNQTTSYTYDLDGRLTQTSYPDNTSESTTYDANGNRLTSKDRAGHITAFTYDALNRLTATTFADNSSSSTTYDAVGQALTSTDANGNTTQYAYDAAGRRTSVTDALTHLTTFLYDADGNQLSVKDANSHTTQYLYDASNRRTKVIYPDNNFETTAYDALGRVTSRTDAKNLTTQYGYDAVGRLTSVTDALQQVTRYVYDELGNRITQTDANTHATTYAYDNRGRRIQRKLPLGQTESYVYDNNGNLSSRTDFNGHTTTYGYDTLNRLLSKTADAYFVTNHLGAAAVTFTYNAQGQRATMSDTSGTTTYTYDARNRLVSKAAPQGALTYTYDAAGDVKSIQSSSVGGANVAYAYDALNRLGTATDATGATTYSYDNAGNLAGFAYPNGVAHAYSYDTRNRLTSLAAAKGATQLAGYGYLLDASGHRLAVTELSGRTVNYAYENLYRLTGETIAADPNSVNGAATYAYDPVGNRTQKVSTISGYPGGLSNYNANDELATDTYDANGNTTSSISLAYAYDFENHLVQQAGLTIVYDGDGNRVAKTTPNGTTEFLVDELNPTGYAQVVEELQSGAVTRTYAWGLGLIDEQQRISGTTTTSYYVFDGHGSVRGLASSTGALTDTYDYDAFGNLLHSTGSTPNNYLYSGEQFDPDLGFYYNRARYLITTTGRFWSMDGFEGSPGFPRSLHKYLYSSGDPVNRVDPSGNQDTLVEEAAEEGEEIAISTQTTVQPAVAATATTAAESVAVAAELKGALINAVLLGITVGTSVTLEGDNQPGPRPNPKNNDDSANRGSLQVQGKDILEGANSLNLVGHTDFKLDKNTLSWNWSQRYPLDVFTANSRLSEFLDILTPVQIGRRRDAFYRASRFINGAALGGGTGPTKQSFNARDPQYPDARVDINVDAGLAFVP
jgi:RHS repeat-associated protein